jgi:hypothetical protein
VSSFAGDAITILFPATDDVGEDLTTATHRAVICGLAMHDAARAFSEAEHIPLALHTGVGAGEALAVRLGGHGDRWEVVVAGDPVEQRAGAGGRAAPGEVVLSPEAIELLGDRVVLRELRDGKAAVETLRTALDPRPLPDAVIPSLDEHILRRAVPSLVSERVDAGMSEWLAEMRTLSAMFVGISGCRSPGRSTASTTRWSALRGSARRCTRWGCARPSA